MRADRDRAMPARARGAATRGRARDVDARVGRTRTGNIARWMVTARGGEDASTVMLAGDGPDPPRRTSERASERRERDD